MKRQPKRSRRRREQTLQLWTLIRAKAAVPYIASVLTSLREHVLEAQAAERVLRKINEAPGRPDRGTLINQEEARKDLLRAELLMEECGEELDNLNIFALNPLQGQVLLPFVHQEQLAWYIFDLFDPTPLRFWRFQEDSLETRRPLDDKVPL